MHENQDQKEVEMMAPAALLEAFVLDRNEAEPINYLPEWLEDELRASTQNQSVNETTSKSV